MKIKIKDNTTNEHILTAENHNDSILTLTEQDGPDTLFAVKNSQRSPEVSPYRRQEISKSEISNSIFINSNTNVLKRIQKPKSQSQSRSIQAMFKNIEMNKNKYIKNSDNGE